MFEVKFKYIPIATLPWLPLGVDEKDCAVITIPF